MTPQYEEVTALMSPKQWATLPYVISGMTDRQISEAMGVKVETTKHHVGRLMCLWQARNRAHLVATVLRAAGARKKPARPGGLHGDGFARRVGEKATTARPDVPGGAPIQPRSEPVTPTCVTLIRVSQLAIRDARAGLGGMLRAQGGWRVGRPLRERGS